ncbi:hypothetical protein HK096_003993, partial [Nowakowskiella sp. JEL0078]
MIEPTTFSLRGVLHSCTELAVFIDENSNSTFRIGGVLALRVNSVNPSVIWARVRIFQKLDYFTEMKNDNFPKLAISLNLAYALKVDCSIPQTVIVEKYISKLPPIHYASIRIGQFASSSLRPKVSQFPNADQHDTELPTAENLKVLLIGSILKLNQKFYLRYLNSTLVISVSKLMFRSGVVHEDSSVIIGEITNATKIETEVGVFEVIRNPTIVEHEKDENFAPVDLLSVKDLIDRMKEFVSNSWTGDNLMCVLIHGKVGVDDLQSTLFSLLPKIIKTEPTAVIFDDIDVISHSNEYGSSIQILLEYVDSLRRQATNSQFSKVLFIATSTKIPGSQIEISRAGRFSDSIAAINITTCDERNRIFEYLCQAIPFEGESKDKILKSISNKTFAFQTSDIQHLLQQVISKKLNESQAEFSVNESDFQKVLEWKKPSQLGEFAIDIPKIQFSELFGLEKTIEMIHEKIILPFEKYETTPQHTLPRGAIIHGPPGVGKSALCYSIINKLGFNCVFVESSQIRSKVIGQTEKSISRLFEDARANAPCVILIDQ